MKAIVSNIVVFDSVKNSIIIDDVNVCHSAYVFSLFFWIVSHLIYVVSIVIFIYSKFLFLHNFL